MYRFVIRDFHQTSLQLSTSSHPEASGVERGSWDGGRRPFPIPSAPVAQRNCSEVKDLVDADRKTSSFSDPGLGIFFDHTTSTEKDCHYRKSINDESDTIPVLI